MSVTPTSIPPISGYWQNTYTLAWRFSSTGYEYYGFQQSNGSFLAHERNIRVNTSTNVWEDGGTTSPDTISESNGVISCFNSTGLLLYSFTKPTTASWITSGGTGGTGGSDPIVTVKSVTLSPSNYPGRAPNSLNPFAGGWIWSQDSVFSYITALIEHHVSSSGYDIVWDNNTVRGTITDSGIDTNGDWFVTTRLPITVDVPDEVFSVEETDTGTGTVGVIDGTAKFRRKVSLNFW
jgi:hypothetical protein